MSRTCFISGAKLQFGNNVSHSNRKTRRTFMLNIKKVGILSEILGRKVTMKVTAAGLRTIEHNGGLDNYLLKTPSTRLTEEARRLKKLVQKASAEKQAAAA